LNLEITDAIFVISFFIIINSNLSDMLKVSKLTEKQKKNITKFGIQEEAFKLGKPYFNDEKEWVMFPMESENLRTAFRMKNENKSENENDAWKDESSAQRLLGLLAGAGIMDKFLEVFITNVEAAAKAANKPVEEYETPLTEFIKQAVEFCTTEVIESSSEFYVKATSAFKGVLSPDPYYSSSKTTIFSQNISDLELTQDEIINKKEFEDPDLAKAGLPGKKNAAPSGKSSLPKNFGKKKTDLPFK